MRIFVLTVRNWPSSPASLPGGSQFRYFVSVSRATSSASTHSLREQNRRNSKTPVITWFADFSNRNRGGAATRGLSGGSGSSTSHRRNRARSKSVICFQSSPRAEHQVSSSAARMLYAFSVLNDRPMSRNEAANRHASWWSPYDSSTTTHNRRPSTGDSAHAARKFMTPMTDRQHVPHNQQISHSHTNR